MSISVSDLVTVRSRHPEAGTEAAARRPRQPLLVVGRALPYPAHGSVESAGDTAVGLL